MFAFRRGWAQLLFLVFGTVLGSASECPDSFQALLGFLERGNTVAHPLDIVSTESPGRSAELRNLIVNSDSKEFNALWSMLSREDLNQLKSMIDAGNIEATNKQKNLLNALIELVEQGGKRDSWVNSDNPRSALATTDQFYRGLSSRGGIGGVVGGIDTSTMTKIEEDIFAAALGNGFSRLDIGGKWRRFWRPLWRPMQNITNFNNKIRRQLEHVDQVRGLILEDVSASRMAKMQKSELDSFREAKKIIDEVRDKVKVELEQAYGDQIETGGYIITEGTNTHSVAQRIKDARLLEKESSHAYDFELASERAVDQVEAALNSFHERTQGSKRTYDGYEEVELRVRHNQRNRQKVEARERRNSHLQEGIKESFTIEYRYTFHKKVQVDTQDITNAEGEKIGETPVYAYIPETRYDTKTINPTYEELLHQRLVQYATGKNTSVTAIDFDEGFADPTGTIVSSGRRIEILEESKTPAQKETAFEEVYSRVSSVLNQAVDENAKTQLLSQTDSELIQREHRRIGRQLEGLELIIAKLQDYVALNKAAVQRQWPKDSYRNFQARNQESLNAALELKHQTEIYLAQLKKKETQLLIESNNPDYSREMRRLRFRHYLYRTTQWAGGTIGMGGVTLGVCEALRYKENFQQSDYDKCYEDLWRTIQNIPEMF